MEEIIRLENIEKEYYCTGETIVALRNLNITVNRGDFISVVGRSGSGKSTLMNILGCLDYPTKGNYFLNGYNMINVSGRDLNRIRSRTIGFIFQGFNLIPTLNAIENIELPMIYQGRPKKERALAARNALKEVGLENRSGHKPSELSGGQQQRVAIARAIAASPEILLADEPTGSLDVASGQEIISIIQALNRSGMTVIMITHDNTIAKTAKRSIRISDGRIIS